MTQKLLTRSGFADLAGVNASTVTRLCSTLLKGAVQGKRIDAGHPSAIEYLARRDQAKTPAPATGIDPLYENAVDICKETNRYSIRGIQKGLGISFARAKAIHAMMDAGGLIKTKKSESASNPKTSQKKTRSAIGQEAVRQNKKSEALQNFDASSDDQIPLGLELPANITELADWTLRDIISRYGTDEAFLDFLKALKEIEVVAEKRLKNAKSRGELISRHIVKSGVIDTLDGAFTRMLTDGAKTIATRAHSLAKTGAPVQEIEDLVAKQLSTFIKPTKSKITRVLRNA